MGSNTTGLKVAIVFALLLAIPLIVLILLVTCDCQRVTSLGRVKSSTSLAFSNKYHGRSKMARSLKAVGRTSAMASYSVPLKTKNGSKMGAATVDGSLTKSRAVTLKMKKYKAKELTSKRARSRPSAAKQRTVKSIGKRRSRRSMAKSDSQSESAKNVSASKLLNSKTNAKQQRSQSHTTTSSVRMSSISKGSRANGRSSSHNNR